jgi:hypothetical protein
MELSNELKTKYSDFIKMMKNLRFDDNVGDGEWNYGLYKKNIK